MFVPKKSEVKVIIERYYNKFKGENCHKLVRRINSLYVGISRERIQDWINHCQQHGIERPIFRNKENLQPIISSTSFEIIQVDLVDFKSYRSTSKNKRYVYVLSVIDVFSRFLMLRPLTKKESASVAYELESIFQTFGNPKIIQTDQGSEFKGKTYYFVLYIN